NGFGVHSPTARPSQCGDGRLREPTGPAAIDSVQRRPIWPKPCRDESTVAVPGGFGWAASDPASSRPESRCNAITAVAPPPRTVLVPSTLRPTPLVFEVSIDPVNRLRAQARGESQVTPAAAARLAGPVSTRS